MYSDQLLHAVLHNDHHDALARNRKRLTDALGILPSTDASGNTTYKDVFRAVLMYDLKYGKCPTAATLREYALTIPNEDTTTGLGEALKRELASFEELWEDRTPEVTDIDVLIDQTITEARDGFWALNFQTAALITTTGREFQVKGSRKKATYKGANHALAYLAQQRVKDIQSETTSGAGWAHEKAEDTFAGLSSVLDGKPVHRLKLGLSNIDERVLIGKDPGMNKYIGVLGHSGDGKSTTLHSIVYQMLMQGAVVLYNSLEHDPEEIFEIMAFLAYDHFAASLEEPGRQFMQPRHIWDMARGGDEDARRRIKPEQVEIMRVILERIRDGKMFPGKLDCRQFASYDEIIDHMKTNESKYHYDALVIDYIDSLTVTGRDVKESKKQLIKSFQTLSRQYNNGKGLVVISPIQVNRAGKEKADAANVDAGEWRYGRDAIREYSEFCHDMDFVFSVYVSEALRERRNTEVCPVKAPRKGRAPVARLFHLDGITDKVMELPTFAGEPKRVDDYRDDPIDNAPPAWDNFDVGSSGYVEDVG